jgi:hypothetical protein
LNQQARSAKAGLFAPLRGLLGVGGSRAPSLRLSTHASALRPAQKNQIRLASSSLRLQMNQIAMLPPLRLGTTAWSLRLAALLGLALAAFLALTAASAAAALGLAIGLALVAVAAGLGLLVASAIYGSGGLG